MYNSLRIYPENLKPLFFGVKCVIRQYKSMYLSYTYMYIIKIYTANISDPFGVEGTIWQIPHQTAMETVHKKSSFFSLEEQYCTKSICFVNTVRNLVSVLEHSYVTTAIWHRLDVYISGGKLLIFSLKF